MDFKNMFGGIGFVEYELEQMSRYLRIVSKAVENERKDFETFVQKTFEELDESERGLFFDLHEDTYLEVTEQFPQLLFSNFLVSWYSYIENKTIQFCKKIIIKLLFTLKII